MTDLPPGWVRVPVTEVADVRGGIQKQAKRRPVENKFPFLRVANVARGRLDLTDVHEIELFDGELERHVLEVGDLLVVEGNGSPAEIGRAALWNGEIERCVHQNHLIRVRPTSAIIPRFLELLWNSEEVRSQLLEVSSSTSGLHTLSTVKIKNIRIPVPPLTEQQRIVAVLETRFAELAKLAALLTSSALRLTHLREFVLEAACTGRLLGLEIADEAIELAPAGVIDGDLPRIPTGWRWVRLGTIADVAGGVTKDTKKQMDAALPLVPYLRVANVQRLRLDLRDVAYIRVPAAKAEQLTLQNGDVLLNEGGDRDKLGRGWIWEGQIDHCIHQNHVFRARVLGEVLHPKLLAWHANSFGRGWFDRNGKQSVNLASISLSKLKLFPVPVPPQELQQALVERAELLLGMIESSEALVERARIRLASLRQKLVTDAFEGRLVEQAAADEPADMLLDRIRVERAAAPKAGSRRRRDASRTEAKKVLLPPGFGAAIPAGAQESLFEQEEVSS
ncbi:restriction endonuclease subunit S [Nonomuraea sp. NPDC005692]|uniref:restriction endonuclease subunit S n=1 Tax=Nonomuraea sp. NPDC005692 TaxID=3157168 RepID=UPI00340AE410